MSRRLDIIAVLFVFLLTLFATACIEQPEIADDQYEVVTEPGVEPVPARDVLVKFACNADCTCPELEGCTPHHILCWMEDGVCQNRTTGCESWCPVKTADAEVPVEVPETP